MRRVSAETALTSGALLGRSADLSWTLNIAIALTARSLAPVLADTSNIRFESGMSVEQHRHFNTLLNSLCTPDPSRPRLQYKRHQEIDYFYSSSSGHHREKVRVTREADTLRTKERGSVVKRRLANLEVYCPNRAFDYRISVNLEIQAQEPPPDASHDFYREKNRLSYTHSGMRVDLTQVKVPPQGSGEVSRVLRELATLRVADQAEARSTRLETDDAPIYRYVPAHSQPCNTNSKWSSSPLRPLPKRTPPHPPPTRIPSP